MSMKNGGLFMGFKPSRPTEAMGGKFSKKDEDVENLKIQPENDLMKQEVFTQMDTVLNEQIIPTVPTKSESKDQIDLSD